MTSHSDEMEQIAKRADDYLHLARRIVVDQFGPEAAHDHVLTIAQVASMMATLEHADANRAAHDTLTELLKRD